MPKQQLAAASTPTAQEGRHGTQCMGFFRTFIVMKMKGYVGYEK
ncbi:MAG TPA: hypothetical protein VK536_06255 [Candidatus Limnocylindrales bacterium]|nr:hypothetical protein [Candidatus Limnocylindrales bacterium]